MKERFVVYPHNGVSQYTYSVWDSALERVICISNKKADCALIAEVLNKQEIQILEQMNLPLDTWESEGGM